MQRDYADLPTIQAFGSELNQVWTNIIDNAVSAMEGQGGIVLRTYREDPWVVVEIKDNGPGIPESAKANLFKKFFQVDTSLTRDKGGSGLGLSICQGIVTAHKGKILVENINPQGASFSFTIPKNQA